MLEHIPGRRLGAVLLGLAAFSALAGHRLQATEGENPVAETSTDAFVHSVYFWLRPDLDAEQESAFVRGLEALREIETVEHGWVGVPAGTDRPIIEQSYSYSLTVVFADDAGHDAYQVHPVHDRFREEFGDFWSRVVIYDSVEGILRP